MISYEAKVNSKTLCSFGQGVADSVAETGEKNMTETEQKKVSLDQAKENLEGNYVQFPDNVRVKIEIVNWEFFEVDKTFEGNTEKKIEIRADVLSVDGVEISKKLATVSKPFQRELIPLIEGKESTQALVVGVKKKGSGKDTTYDIELVPVA